MGLPELIPIDVLFGNPERTLPQLSPDGKRLAFLAPDEGFLNVWVGDVGSDEFKPVTKDRKRGIMQYGWAYDGRHLFYLRDTGGDENWRLYTVDLESGDVVDRTPFDGVQAQVIGTSERRPDEILIGLNKDDPRYHDVYRLRLSTGELTKEIANPGLTEWVADHELNVRLASKPREDGGIDVVKREGWSEATPSEGWSEATPSEGWSEATPSEGWSEATPSEGDDFTLLYTIEPDDYVLNVTHPILVNGDDTKLYTISTRDVDVGRLVTVDLETGETTPIVADDSYDLFIAGGGFSRTCFAPETYEVRLVPVMRDRMHYIVLDESLEPHLDAIRAACRGDMWLVGRDLADTTWLVLDTADNASSRYLAYDRESKTAKVLFETQPALSAYELANMEPFSYTSRDGLAVHGYATFPVGVDRKDLPTVLHVHGGPWGARHFWGYNPIAQWLANRGYLCLEIDYRGSGGYGKAFLNASNREWAGRMHDDLIDGLEYAIEQGWTDRSRTAIFGGSYGGYAALVGATFTPDVFKCVVDYVGPSNLITLLESVPPYWFAIAKQFSKLLGDPAKDRDFLWERSPLSRVDQIKIPVFIAQGANDPRVKQAESEQIVAAMKERGLDYEYLLFEDEGHGFMRPENREKFHLDAERFLAKHLGGRALGAEALAGAAETP